MQDLASLALTTHSILEAYVAIHDDIFAPSLWRTIRRSIPIPGFFEPVPFSVQANHLKRLRANLASIQIAAGRELLSEANDDRVKFLRAIQEYCKALAETISRLLSICEKLAAKANGVSTISLEAYAQEVDEYRQSTQNYERAGETLNQFVRDGLYRA